ncbi:MAG: hypothetical protein R3A80_04350 [Bdellovibrionota bacterium]
MWKFYFVFLMSSPVFASSTSHINKSGKNAKELMVDGALYCSVVNRKLANVYENAPLEARLERYSGHLKELIVVMDYKEQEKKSGKTEQHPKCLQSYKTLVTEELAEIKKLSRDSYEKAILEGDYQYIVGEYRLAKNSYARASQVITGDLNSGTKELASVVQILDHNPKERENLDYWQKDIRLIFKGMNKANKQRPELLNEIKKMSKDLGVRLVKLLDFFLGYAHASFSFNKFLNFGAGIGHAVEGTPESSDLSQKYVRSKGFSQLILTREDLMDLIKEKMGKGGSLKKALGSLFPSASDGVEVKITITNNINNNGDTKDKEGNEKENADKKLAGDGANSPTVSTGVVKAIDKNGKAWDPNKPLSAGTGGFDPETLGNFNSWLKGSQSTAKGGSTGTSGSDDPITKALTGSDKLRHEKAQEKKAACLENPTDPSCKPTVTNVANNKDSDVLLTEPTRPQVIVAAATPPEEEKKKTQKEPEKKPTQGRGLVTKPPTAPPSVNVDKFSMSPTCSGANAVSTLVSTVRSFSYGGDMAKSGTAIGGIGNCYGDWNNFLKAAQKQCGGVVGPSKRCGGTKEGDFAACKESIEAVSNGMAQEFYGGDPNDVSTAVQQFGETGELPKDHMSGVVCEFAGMVNVGNALVLYGGSSGGTSVSGAGGSVAH